MGMQQTNKLIRLQILIQVKCDDSQNDSEYISLYRESFNRGSNCFYSDY